MMVGRQIHSYFMLCWILLLSSCSTKENVETLNFSITTPAEFSREILSEEFDYRRLKQAGPFKIDVIKDFSFSLGIDSTIAADIYIPKTPGQAPLVILQHGNLASKETHSAQGEHLASWGFLAIVPSLPNQHQWMKNGERLAHLMEFLYQWPKILHNKFDPAKMILIGHSFGGSAVTIASSKYRKSKGVILLDPAVYNEKVVAAIKANASPTVIVGADKARFLSRRRNSFYKFSAKIAEVSIEGATHDDAQKPSSTELRFWFDPVTSESSQKTFLSAMTFLAYSFAYTDGFSAAIPHFESGKKLGEFKQLKIKERGSY